MKLVIFNGSPRGKNSNTKVLLDQFAHGFVGSGGEVVNTDYLFRQKHISEQVQHFKNADVVFCAFPLCVFSVPGIVKQFFEAIGDFDSKFRIAINGLLQKTGLTNFYWNMNLKKNGAFERRFDVPYLNS